MGLDVDGLLGRRVDPVKDELLGPDGGAGILGIKGYVRESLVKPTLKRFRLSFDPLREAEYAALWATHTPPKPLPSGQRVLGTGSRAPHRVNPSGQSYHGSRPVTGVSRI